ncbi:SIR2 family protein [candidate division KSB1 bacterium]|nr:SIR2 family protein [candidate division KSB1 bacterium]
MGSRVFIIGAGFSKAIADAPLASEFMKLIYESATNGEIGKETGWYEGQNAFIEIVKGLEKSIEHGFDIIEEDGTEIKNRNGLELISSINIEHLCTLLDLNINRPFIPKGKGVDLKSCPIPFMDNMQVRTLEHARSFIMHYIIKLLLPNSLKTNQNLLSKFSKYLRPGDIIITFNYDILIEQALWNEQLWSPIDGYQLGIIDDYLELKDESSYKSKISIIKLHGSINWIKPGLFDNDIKILITDPLTHAPYFDGFKFKFKVKRKTEYRLLDSMLITPTFMKSYANNQEIGLMKFAFESIAQCSELYSIGYSFPDADFLSIVLGSQISDKTQITIIDQNANEIAEYLEMTFGINKKNIINEESSIEEWILGNFEFSAYKENCHKTEVFQKILDAGRRKNQVQ